MKNPAPVMMVVEEACFPFFCLWLGWAGKNGKSKEKGECGPGGGGGGGSCRVLNSLGKERGWWRGPALGFRRRTGGTRSTFVCTSLCASMNWQHLSEETHGPSSLPSPSRSPQEKLHHPQAWSFSTLGQYLAPPHFLGRTLSRRVFSPLCLTGQHLTWPNPLFTPLFHRAAAMGGDNGRQAGCHGRAGPSGNS